MMGAWQNDRLFVVLCFLPVFAHVASASGCLFYHVTDDTSENVRLSCLLRMRVCLYFLPVFAHVSSASGCLFYHETHDTSESVRLSCLLRMRVCLCFFMPVTLKCRIRLSVYHVTHETRHERKRSAIPVLYCTSPSRRLFRHCWCCLMVPPPHQSQHSQ